MTRDEEFAKWVLEVLDVRRWRQADLAREANIDTGLLSRLMKGKQRASPDMCNSIARVLGYPPDSVLRKAGYLPDIAPVDYEDQKMLNELYVNLSPANRERVLKQTQLLYEEETQYRVIRVPNKAWEKLWKSLTSEQQAFFTELEHQQKEHGRVVAEQFLTADLSL